MQVLPKTCPVNVSLPLKSPDDGLPDPYYFPLLREKKLLKLSEVLFNKSLSVCIQTATAAGKNREVFQEKASLTIYSYKL